MGIVGDITIHNPRVTIRWRFQFNTMYVWPQINKPNTQHPTPPNSQQQHPSYKLWYVGISVYLPKRSTSKQVYVGRTETHWVDRSKRTLLQQTLKMVMNPAQPLIKSFMNDSDFSNLVRSRSYMIKATWSQVTLLNTMHPSQLMSASVPKVQLTSTILAQPMPASQKILQLLSLMIATLKYATTFTLHPWTSTSTTQLDTTPVAVHPIRKKLRYILQQSSTLSIH